MDNRLKRLFFPIMIAIMISLACTSPLQPAATTTPEPSVTPLPTNTPIPTKTATRSPTPTFTSTPDRAAEATAAMELVIDQFRAEMDNHDISTDSGHLGWVQDTPIQLNDVGHLNIEEPKLEFEYRRMADGMEAGDFIFKTDITWNYAGDASIYCGLVFRADSRFTDGEHYRFLFHGPSPGWAISFWDGMEHLAGFNSIGSDALKTANGATNQIIIVAEDNAFFVFINGVLEKKVTDLNSLRSVGQFGVAHRLFPGNISCDFENTIIWVYK